jgi:DNA-binding NarL/FixJ family response regulator
MQEVLKIADGLVFDKTGKHLNNLQIAILKGVLEKQQYAMIAEEYKCSEGHVKDVSYELWRVLSEALGERVLHSNLKAVFERNINAAFVHIGDNVCSNPQQSKKIDKNTDSVLKLNLLGLSVEQIANALSLSIENVQEIISNSQQ